MRVTMKILDPQGWRAIDDRDVLHVSWHGEHGDYDLVTVYLTDGPPVTGLVQVDGLADQLLPAA